MPNDVKRDTQVHVFHADLVLQNDVCHPNNEKSRRNVETQFVDAQIQIWYQTVTLSEKIDAKTFLDRPDGSYAGTFDSSNEVATFARWKTTSCRFTETGSSKTVRKSYSQ